ncbi:MAG: hypothetical protein MPK75_12360, partial [Alphaproteobacteria bacterium]|nr:hypothetical protein [Alphaproteobacteria bacterium]
DVYKRQGLSTTLGRGHIKWLLDYGDTFVHTHRIEGNEDAIAIVIASSTSRRKTWLLPKEGWKKIMKPCSTLGRIVT